MSAAFDDFKQSLKPAEQAGVQALHEVLLNLGCQAEVNEAKSGYTVSYLKPDRKTLANFVCRKTGVKLRLYPEGLARYEAFLSTLPEAMKKAIRKASVCKRLIDPDDCNPRCQTGYTFSLDGESFQKCRYMAFFFNVNENTLPSLFAFLEQERQAAEASIAAEFSKGFLSFQLREPFIYFPCCPFISFIKKLRAEFPSRSKI